MYRKVQRGELIVYIERLLNYILKKQPRNMFFYFQIELEKMRKSDRPLEKVM